MQSKTCPADFSFELADGVWTYRSVGSGTDATAGVIQTNDSRTFTFTVALAQTIEPYRTTNNVLGPYTNAATFDASSIRDNGPMNTQRWYSVTNSAILETTDYGMEKVLFATSETMTPPDSASNNVQVGEIAYFDIVLSLPTALYTNLVVGDEAPAGLAYLGYEIVDDAFRGAAYAGDNPMAVRETPLANGISLAFTNMVSWGEGSQVKVRVATLVTNAAAVTNGVVLTNRAWAAYAGETNATDTAVVKVGEPKLTIAKWIANSTNLTNRDAGDVVTVKIAVTNKGTAGAYDVLVTDALATNVFDITSVSNVNLSPATGYLWAMSNNVFSVWSDPAAVPQNALATNGALIASFDVTLADTIEVFRYYTNWARIEASSIRTNGPAETFRTYSTSNSARLRVPMGKVQKVLQSTSETITPPDSATNLLQVGELVTYRIDAYFPEGYSTNAVIRDTLGAKWQACQSITIDTNAFDGTIESFSTSPTRLPTAGGTTTYVYLTNVWVAGTSGTNYAVLPIYLTYLATNAPTMTSGALATNQARFTIGSGSVNSDKVTTEAVEPVPGIEKTISPTNGLVAGDMVTVTLVATNAGNAALYETVVADVLDPGTFDLATVAPTTVPDGFEFRLSGDTAEFVRVAGSAGMEGVVEAGGSRTFAFTVALAQGLRPGSVYTNVATVGGDSIRTNGPAGVYREYGATNDAVFSTLDGGIAKSLRSTSESYTEDDEVTIGETVQYNLLVTLPAGTVSDFAIGESWDSGLEFLRVVDVLTDDFYGTLSTTNPTVVGGTNILFPGETVASTNVPAGTEHKLTVVVEARVRDVEANVGLPDAQTTLTNQVSLSYFGRTVATSEVVSVTVVEPRVEVSKTLSYDLVAATNGWVDVTLTWTNSGLSPAWLPTYSDTLPSAFWTGEVEDTDWDGYDFAIASSNGTVLTWTALPDAPSNTCLDVGATTSKVFRAQLVPGLVGNATNWAMVADVSTLDDPDGYERTEPPATNYATLTLVEWVGAKIWDDAADTNARPESIGLRLLTNGAVWTGAPDPTWSGTSTTNWAYSFTGLPPTDGDGQAIVYSVEEYGIPQDYALVSTDGRTLVNRLATTNAEVTKIWDDSADTNARPASVTVDLLRDGEVWFADQVLAASNGWTLAWSNLPAYRKNTTE